MNKLIAFFITASLFSCQSKQPISLDYCQMFKDDQSFVNQDKSDLDKFNADRTERHRIFKRNFDQILALTEQDGFPNVSFYDLPKDSCKYWAVSATLIHIAQSKPELFFSEKIVKLFKSEIDKANMNKELLQSACKVSFLTMEFCEDLKTNINDAVKLWGIEDKLSREPKFAECENQK